MPVTYKLFPVIGKAKKNIDEYKYFRARLFDDGIGYCKSEPNDHAEFEISQNVPFLFFLKK